jgi:3,2-trans-enoyl-CoA isomerase
VNSQAKLQFDGAGAFLTLDHGRANAIGLQMVDELLAALDEAENEESIRTLILTGKPGMFSAGLDVPELVGLDRSQMKRFWETFNRLCYRLYTSDLMIVSAISGHSPAGGCVLAIMTDYRIMASGAFKIGLNEVGVGIPIPGGLTEVYASLIGLRRAQDLGCRGAMVNPQSALQIGLVDEVVPADKLLEAADAKESQPNGFFDAKLHRAWRSAPSKTKKPFWTSGSRTNRRLF